MEGNSSGEEGSQKESTSNSTIISQPGRPFAPQSKSNKWLVVCLVIFLILILCIAGVFAYQNYQLKKQLSTQNNSGESLQTQSPLLPTLTLSSIIPSFDWEQYKSTIGLNFLKPSNAYVSEPNLIADISIESEDNKRENQEIIDGWVIGITYTPNQFTPSSIKDKAEESNLQEKERDCVTTPISSVLIGGKTAYFFYVTSCLHFSSSLYFVQSDSTYYVINAEYVGDIEQYREITDKIITSITFTE